MEYFTFAIIVALAAWGVRLSVQHTRELDRMNRAIDDNALLVLRMRGELRSHTQESCDRKCHTRMPVILPPPMETRDDD